MPKRFLKFFLIGLLIVSIVLPAQLSLVSSSTGNIYINSTSTSAVGQQVQSGGRVNLFFGNVSWSGSTVYLFMSTNDSEEIATGDFVYTPQFSVANISASVTSGYSDNNGGSWTLGSNWVNGTIAQNVAVGNYYIKAFDQYSGAMVAVTDTYITVNSQNYSSTLNLTPSAGPGGVSVQFTGSSYPPGSTVFISYYDPTFGTWNYLTQTVANASGDIVASSQAPDLEKSLTVGDCPQQYNQINYRTTINNIVYANANYDEYERGLSMVGTNIASGLFGNGTNLDTSVRTMPGDVITIVGEWFHPGVIYIRWDSLSVVGTVTSDQWQSATILGTTAAGVNGTFSTSVTIPAAAEAGDHFIQIEDSQTWMVVTIYVSTATLSISPAYGPGGANVQFTGSRYPALTVVNVTYEGLFGWNLWASTTSDASGNIALNCQMPDLQNSFAAGDSGTENSSSSISFRAEINNKVWSYVSYNENFRGIKQVGSQIATGLYGNGTNLSSNVNVNPGTSILISGEWFYPGVVYIRFDGAQVVTTVTSSQWQTAQIIGSTVASSTTGSFSTYVTIPTANAGTHFLAIEDSQTRIIIIINVNSSSTSPTPTPTPAPTTTPTYTPTPTPAPSPTPSTYSNPTPSPTSAPSQTPQPTPSPPHSLTSPTLTVSCASSTSYNGFKVEINGNLAASGTGLSGLPIQISDSVTGGSSWNDLTLVNTGPDGSFSAEWLPSITGNYLINATFAGDSSYSKVCTVVSLAIMPFRSESTQDVFSVASNSTVTDLAFNSTSRELSFTVSGPSGTTGYVDTYIAKTLIGDVSTLKVFLDDSQVNYVATSQGDSWLIHFAYHHSTHTVVMSLGEATSAPVKGVSVGTIAIASAAAIAVIVAVILAVVVLKRKKSKLEQKTA